MAVVRRREWLSDLLRRRGLSQHALADAIGVHRGTPGRWVRGVQDLAHRHRRALAETLGISLDDLDRMEADYRAGADTAPDAEALSLPDGVLDPDEVDRLTHAARRPSRADEHVVTSLAVLLAEQRRTEDRIGSAPLVSPVAAQLELVTDLVVDARGPIRPAMVDVAGQWAQFLAWLNTSTGKHDAARAWWDRAAEWAAEADNRTLAANVLSFKGHMAWMNNQPGPTIGLSQAAQRDPAVAVSQRAYDAHQEARGHAMAGDIPAAERKLDDALELADLATDEPDGKAPWSYYYSPALYTAEHGLVHLHLSFQDTAHAGRAVDFLTEGIAGFGDDDASDWAAEWRYNLALAHVQNDDPDTAAEVAGLALTVAQRTQFDRLIVALRGLHRRMTTRFPGQPAVEDLGALLAQT